MCSVMNAGEDAERQRPGVGTAQAARHLRAPRRAGSPRPRDDERCDVLGCEQRHRRAIVTRARSNTCVQTPRVAAGERQGGAGKDEGKDAVPAPPLPCRRAGDSRQVRSGPTPLRRALSACRRGPTRTRASSSNRCDRASPPSSAACPARRASPSRRRQQSATRRRHARLATASDGEQAPAGAGSAPASLLHLCVVPWRGCRPRA